MWTSLLCSASLLLIQGCILGSDAEDHCEMKFKKGDQLIFKGLNSSGEGCCVFKNRAVKIKPLIRENLKWTAGWVAGTRDVCEDSSCSKASKWEGCKARCKAMKDCEQFQWNPETKVCVYFSTRVDRKGMFSGSKECEDDETNQIAGRQADCVLKPWNGKGCCVFKKRAVVGLKLTPQAEISLDVFTPMVPRPGCDTLDCSSASKWEGCQGKCKAMKDCEQFQWNSETLTCTYFSTSVETTKQWFSGLSKSWQWFSGLSKSCIAEVKMKEVLSDEESGADYILSSFFLIVSSLLVNIVMV